MKEVEENVENEQQEKKKEEDAKEVERGKIIFLFGKEWKIRE